MNPAPSSSWVPSPNSSAPDVAFPRALLTMADAVVPDATKAKLEAIMQTMIALQKGMMLHTSSRRRFVAVLGSAHSV